MHKILKISEGNFGKKIKIIIREIKDGRVLVLPTDTVYGLISDATNEKSVKKIFRIKKRPKNKVLSIFIRDLKTAKDFAFINESQENFLKKAWPGRLTAVLKAKPRAKKLFKFGIISPENKIGLRVPRHKLINSLLKESNLLLAQTSANISGKRSLTKIKSVLEEFEKEECRPDLIVDERDLPESKPSIVLDLATLPPKILRL